ncbi:uncharacterized protein LOC113291690 [Papaver somniferum]|uniref:uncharacterized protein LOC113291690 n=1 Tax=Papaver somniferum TaxID=3469 RepID=UPI000E705B42|nr:uncharacterized protein LOC113291690 [Papaver somniferum]
MSLVATASAKEPSMMNPCTEDGGLLFEFVDDEEEDLCISIDCLRSASTKHLNPLFNNIDHQNISPRRSVADKEISVDPISIKQSLLSTTGRGGEYVVTRNLSFVKPPDADALVSLNPSMMKPPASPVAVSRIDSANCKYPPPVPPPAISPSKSINRFLSCSLPSSPSSSPLCGPPSLMKNIKKWRNSQNHLPPPPPLPPAINYLGRQRSAAVSPFAATDDSGSYIARSKSLGEGRRSAPSVDFDIWSKKVNEHRNEQQSYLEDDDTNSNMADYYEEFEEDDVIKTIRRIRSKKGKAASGKYRYGDDEFKCGSLSCLYLPGFGKGKQVRPRKQDEEDYSHQGQGAEEVQPVQAQQAPVAPKQHVIISRTVSLEKFECGSWSSAGMINDDRDEADSSHYFDLPLELIRNSANDADGPVNTAFVFEREIKGVLKNSSSRRDQPRLSQESPSTRHVRFSTSSSNNAPSTCITPRLRKAREDFNALLEAQGV